MMTLGPSVDYTPALPPLYNRVLEAVKQISSRLPDIRVCIYGSAATGEVSWLRDVDLPLSDVDLLILADEIDQLNVAAREFAILDCEIRRTDAPFFKLGVKFRLLSELRIENLTVNELAAARFGRWLSLGPLQSLPATSIDWYRDQSVLSLKTRRIYDMQRWDRVKISLYREEHEAYLAARMVLELTTAILLSRGVMAPTYATRVELFCSLVRERTSLSDEENQTLMTVRAALRYKLDPAGHGNWSLQRADSFLIENARLWGIPIESSESAEERERFWTSYRPLDRRDHALWATAGGQR